MRFRHAPDNSAPCRLPDNSCSAFYRPSHVRYGLWAIPFILLAMPSGANTAMMAERYDGDSVYGSMAVSLTTLLSIITIPLMSLLLTLL